MAQSEREMIDRWDAEENERRQSAGEPPHGRDWPYLTMEEISEAWGIPRLRLVRFFSRSAAIREIIIKGEPAIYRRWGSKVPIYRIPIPVFRSIRAVLNEQFFGMRSFMDVDVDLDPKPLARTSLENGSVRCVSINGFPVAGNPTE